MLRSVVVWYSKTIKMKKTAILCLLFAFAATSFCQQTVQKHSLAKTDYLQKSKKQKKIGWILTGGGAVMIAIGAIIPEGQLTDELSYPCLCYNVHENDGVKGGFILAGLASGLSSIPFFIASGKNKRRAASVSFKNQTILQLQRGSFVFNTIPGLNFKISL
jgi:hypothetical protein